jgi:hypothetical protein
MQPYVLSSWTWCASSVVCSVRSMQPCRFCIEADRLRGVHTPFRARSAASEPQIAQPEQSQIHTIGTGAAGPNQAKRLPCGEHELGVRAPAARPLGLLASAYGLALEGGSSGSGAEDLIPLTVPEVRRLLSHLYLRPHAPVDRVLAWFRWRRTHQARARLHHHQTRTKR